MTSEELPADLLALDRTCEEFAVDRARVYLTGLSMGGHGSWMLGYHHAQRFAAMLVICGFVGDRPNRASVVPSGEGTPYERVAARLRDMPIWIVHGEADPLVPVSESRLMHEALLAVNGIGPVKVEKYGAAEVNTWWWEVWNEPNYLGQWQSGVDPARYARLLAVADGLADDMAALGMDAAPTTPEQFDAFVRTEMGKWARAVKDSGAKAD